MKRLWMACLLLAVAACGAKAQVVRNYPLQSYLAESPVTVIYRVPEDSAVKYAGNVLPRPEVSWLQKPAAACLHGQVDSVIRTLPGGYYLTFKVALNKLYTQFIHNKSFEQYVLNDKNRIKLVYQDLNEKYMKDVKVYADGIPVPYNELQQAYLLKPRLGHSIRVSAIYGGDGLYNEVISGWYTPSRYSYEDYYGSRYQPSRPYKGYLVTNQPQYLPGDTVKYKAYLLDRYSDPETLPLKVTLTDMRNYGSSIIINSKLKPIAPGVYNSWFVLGDSLKIDRNYQLQLRSLGERYISQEFRLEDYLLDENYLRVIHYHAKEYDPSDTIKLYSYAYNSNNLPVLDGQIEVTIKTKDVTQLISPYIATRDTLFHISQPVNASGEILTSIPCNSFPQARGIYSCMVSLTNSNFERRDTAFDIPFNGLPIRLSATRNQEGLWLHASENGYPIKHRGIVTYTNGAGEVQNDTIIYPYLLPQERTGISHTFLTYQPNKALLMAYRHQPDTDSLIADYGYNVDTAIFNLFNPKGIPFHYAIYNGGSLHSSGVTDTGIHFRIVNKKFKTVTIIGQYLYNGKVQSRTYNIFKTAQDLRMDVRKKSIIYPGQTDTINIRLTNEKGKPIGHTNVTALAYNANFKTDHVADISQPALVSDDAGLGLNVRTESLTPSKKNEYRINHYDWYRIAGADSIPFYKNIVTTPDSFWVNTMAVSGIDTPQFSAHILDSGKFVYPWVIYVDQTPVFMAGALNASSAAACYTERGLHKISVRTWNKQYDLPAIQFNPGEKTDIFIDANRLFSGINRIEKPDSFSQPEKDLLARHAFFYRDEQRTFPAFFNQNGRTFVIPPTKNIFNVEVLFPINPYDSVGFFQPSNTFRSFMPERNYIFSINDRRERIEKTNPYLYIKAPSKAQLYWPEFGFVTENPKDICITQALYYQSLNRQHRSAYVFEKADPLEIIRENKHTAFFILLNMPQNVQAIIARNFDTPLAYSFARDQGPHSIPTGKTVFYYINDNLAYTSDTITIQQEKQYYLNLSNRTFDRAFDFEDAQKWMGKGLSKTEITTDQMINVNTQKSNTYTDYCYNGCGGFQGIIYDERKQPIIGASVVINRNGQRVGGAKTDFDGRFSIKPITPGKYTLTITYIGYKIKTVDVTAWPSIISNVGSFQLDVNAKTTYEYVMVQSKRESTNKADEPPTKRTLVGAEISKLAVRNTSSMASLAPGVYQSREGAGLSFSGGRADATTIYQIDGIQIHGSRTTNNNHNEAERFRPGKTDQAKDAFVQHFMDQMNIASGLRTNFRDYAIWEPNLWTNKEGNTSFNVTYPDNNVAWKTYILAMNSKGYAGIIMSLTRAFKPITAELSAPRFLLHGDTAEVIGKTLNYTDQTMRIQTWFSQDSTRTELPAAAVTNARIDHFKVGLSRTTNNDTSAVQLTFSLKMENGFEDGSQIEIPILPVGIRETKGIFTLLKTDSSFRSRPETQKGFTGKSIVYVDGSLVEVMLREIENLKLYPHGCMEQITTKLSAISYEERIKTILGNKQLNNEKTKQQIIQKLVEGQHEDGSFGWWKTSDPDIRITNYVTNTLRKSCNDSLTQLITKRTLQYLENQLANLQPNDLLPTLQTLSDAGFAANYGHYLKRFNFDSLSTYNQSVLLQILKQQNMAYDSRLKQLVTNANRNFKGELYWSNNSRYDWSRDDVATTLNIYTLLENEHGYNNHRDSIVNYLLMQRRNGYYTNTAQSGMVLNAVLPELLKHNTYQRKNTTSLTIEGSAKAVIKDFPHTFTVQNQQPEFTFTKKGISPVYVSVKYEYVNPKPDSVSGHFTVRSFISGDSTQQPALKQGDQYTLRTQVTCKENTEYVMIEIPIPAGCVQVNKEAYRYRYPESHRENYKNATYIFCGYLPKGTHVFDVDIQCRFAGKYTLNPAKAEMMYFADQFGRTGSKTITIKK